LARKKFEKALLRNRAKRRQSAMEAVKLLRRHCLIAGFRVAIVGASAGRELMKTTTELTLITAALMALSGMLHAQEFYPFQNQKLPLEDRVTNILSLMTLQEKEASFATSTAVPRLGIPDAGSSEGLHGLVQSGGFGGPSVTTTTFPEVIGLASTWDPELIRRVAAVQANEARYITQNPKYKHPVLVVWGPNADLARDPRWGRNNESYGEDPFLVGTMSTAFVRGLQGDTPNQWEAASLLKHFLSNSNETTRGHSSSNYDTALFWDYYAAPFRMAIEGGGATSLMASYNAWNHVPMTVNPVIKNVVVKQWGADGIVSSDATAVEQLVTGHKYVVDQETALADTVKAGISQILTFVPDLPGRLQKAIDAKLLTEADLDGALRGKFRTVIRLGLLDSPNGNPYAKIGTLDEPEPWNTPQHKALALDAARESVVLLKNANSMLPLDRAHLKSVAVIGPRANDNLLDMYAGKYPYSITPLEGIKSKVDQATVVRYADGSDIEAAAKAAQESEIAIVVVGNHPVCGDKLSGQLFNTDTSTKPCSDLTEGREGRDRESIDLLQEGLIQRVFGANPKTIVVLVSSFPYAIGWTQSHVPAILHTAHASQEEGNAVADVLFGDYSPAGRLNQTWPKALTQLPPMDDYDIRHGRTYMYFKGEPLYPFGFGLSYSTFKYSNIKVHASSISRTGGTSISVDIQNTGSRTGDEVVQLYVRRLSADPGSPREQLKGFRRVTLAPGEKRTTSIPVDAGSLAMWDDTTHQLEVKPGAMELLIGSSSSDIRGKGDLQITP
jgi:beta-glucosidase